VERRWRQRLHWTRDEVVATLESTNRAVVARSFAYLFGLGAILVSVAPAFPGVQVRHPSLIAVAAGLAALTSIAVLTTYDQTPDVVLRCLPGLGTALVTLVLLGSEDSAIAPYALLYFWVALSAFYFFGRTLGLVHLLGVIACFAVVLAVSDVDQSPMLMLMMAGTLGVTGVMLALLRSRADTLILSLDAAARTDALTGVLNRRAFDDRFDEELARASRTKRPLTLLLIDIDGFKSINDRFGHQAGDRVLQQVANAFSQGRTIDKVGRLGGDEFALLLPETSASGATELADRLKPSMEPAVSVGIASWPDHGTTAAELHEAADCALYAAKHGGGDRAVVYELSMRRGAASVGG